MAYMRGIQYRGQKGGGAIQQVPYPHPLNCARGHTMAAAEGGGGANRSNIFEDSPVNSGLFWGISFMSLPS